MKKKMKLTVPEIDCSQGFTEGTDVFNRKNLSFSLRS